LQMRNTSNITNPNNFDIISIKLASPEEIKWWAKRTACHCPPPKNLTCSCGEVKKPETINYRTFKPERDGLFCEAIFGPVKDWECSCGKYKRIKNKGIVCDKCGVEVTQSRVRRERMGYIQLAAPVTHIWFFKGTTINPIGTILGTNFSLRDLERVIYFESYIVIDPGDSPLEYRQRLTEEEYIRYKEHYNFHAEMGASALKKVLSHIDLDREIEMVKEELQNTNSKQKRKKLQKRLKLLYGFKQSGNRPEWMILDVIPVLPPELRPLVALDGGRFATSDLNDLYRRVINRNNRLKRLMDLHAPEVIIRNEKRMLQESVDALLDNGRHGRVVRGPRNRPLKSLSDMLKGKTGRFRQNLLGKRVDYSGRSVIVIGPELKMDECGLPKKMATELFKPFIIHKLQERGYAQAIRSAKRMAERISPEVWEVLEEVIAEHPVLLNRAPTLHRLGIQAFHPMLVEEKAIRIHPLVCKAFNADFDGDQMAVHVPLSAEAQVEAKLLMNAERNLLKPAHGWPIAVPTLDMVLGIDYLTKEKPTEEKDGNIPVFPSPDDVIYAHNLGHLDLHSYIKLRVDGHIITTTVGRVIFNQIIPEELTFYDEEAKGEIHFLNKEVHAREISDLVAMVFDKCGNRKTVEFLDNVKELGFHYATVSGVSMSIDDLIIPKEKWELIEQARKEAEEVEKNYRDGLITNSERYNKVVSIWSNLTREIEAVLIDALRKGREDEIPGFNPVNIMVDSGARSKKEPIRQLAGMRGLMTKPSGEIIERPIFANFREGLTVLDYFISTHGARKGLADTAIKTASSGYLTRKLIDVAQDVVITEEDCGTLNGIVKSSLEEEEAGETLGNRVFGRTALEDIKHPITGELIVKAGDLIDREAARKIDEAGITEVKIRSVLTCETTHGICRKCYGMDMTTGKLVDIGEAVGIIAAQSIGEPGTQLTMRTFHTGGAVVASEQTEITAKNDGVVKYQNVRFVKRPDGEIVSLSRHGQISILDETGYERERHRVMVGARIKVEDGGQIHKGDVLLEWDPDHLPILTEVGGKVKFFDIVEGLTMSLHIDEITGMVTPVIIEPKDTKLQPRIEVLNDKGEPIGTYHMPTGAHLSVDDGDMVHPGDTLARIPRERAKARDIVTGLPRVTELFEARRPKDAAFIAEIDGYVRIIGTSRGVRLVKIENPDEGIESETYRIPIGKHMIVREGEWVRAGDRLTEGPLNPHDILRVRGETAVQSYLVNQIQEVYRAQGERINDKHIEVIVRQMMKKVRIEDPGDTEFLEGDQVDRVLFRQENERVVSQGGRPATAQPILQGITKAALTTESFISASSFQQTTKVLTEAALYGKKDKLKGLKENVIVGRLIPAGTGVPQLRRIEVYEKGSLPPEEKGESSETGAIPADD